MDKKTTEILFDKFEILSCLKKDSQTGVYLANHIFLGKKILLKTLNTEGLSDSTILERFKREAKILAQLEHPNLIKVLDFGTHNNFFYISFEYFESKNLREIISSNNLSQEEKKFLLIQLLQALNTAHYNQIIHRDIKPENILVNSNNELKIADFGLALIINDNNLTNNSTIVGTPSYMAPEQIRGEKTQQTDLFSTGLVAYELFTGRNPVLGSAMGETINNILNFNFENCSSTLNFLPDDLKLAIKSMLQNDLRRRAKSANEILKILGVEENRNTTQTNSFNISPQKHNYKKAIIMSFIVIIAGLLGLMIRNVWSYANKEKPEQTVVLNDKLPVKNDVAIQKNNSISVKKPEAEVSKEKQSSVSLPAQKTSIKRVISTTENLPGKVFIDSYPWSVVYIDNKKIDNTPINEFTLSPGEHNLELLHPDYPAYTQKIFVTSGKKDSIYVNMNNLFGFLKCSIYPWGKIYIDGKYIGITPLVNSIVLKPGKYNLTVENENFSPVSKVVTISPKNTIDYKLNFEELNK